VQVAARVPAVGAAAAALAILAFSAPAVAYSPPPANAGFDYQIGGDYPLPAGVSVVSRDWFSGKPAADPAYSICYVNAFQTQANEPGTDRPDEHSNWPKRLILEKLGDDPHWGGEYLVDISTRRKRTRAAGWVRQMVARCADAGHDAVEFDNLDSWTRFNGTPLKKKVPFGKRQAIAYAKLLATQAHRRDLAVGQKNTAGLTRSQVKLAGFDFAIAEECGRYRECNRYTAVYGDDVIAIEYRRKDFRRTCATVGERISVVLRDRLVSRPGSQRYVYDAC
jgi:Glycoside-hydrolase family GH114